MPVILGFLFVVGRDPSRVPLMLFYFSVSSGGAAVHYDPPDIFKWYVINFE